MDQHELTIYRWPADEADQILTFFAGALREVLKAKKFSDLTVNLFGMTSYSTIYDHDIMVHIRYLL